MIFYFGTNLKGLLAAVTLARSNRYRAMVIDASYSGELERDYAYLGARHISEWSESPGVRGARELAAEWMQLIPQQPLVLSGIPFLATFSSDRVPLWWLFEISLQERAYLTVRLIEAVRAIVATELASHYAVVDDHPTHVWKSGVVARTCSEAGLQHFEIPADSPSGSIPAVEDPPGSRTRRWLDVRPARSSWWLGGRIARKLAAIVAAAAGAILGTLVGAVALAIVVPMWILRWLVTLGHPGPGLAKSYAALVVSPIRINKARVDLLVAIAAATMTALALVTWPRWEIPFLVVAGIAAAAGIVYALMVAFAPARLGFGAQVRWPARAIRAAIGQRRRLVRQALIRLQGKPGEGAAADTRPILVLLDEGNVRRRLDVTRGRVSEYIPYLEGVIEALRSQNQHVVVASYGDPRRVARGMLGRLQRAQLLLMSGRRSSIRIALDETKVRRADLVRQRRVAEWDVIAGDPGLQSAFSYKGVDCWPVFVGELRTFFTDSSYSEEYQAAFGEILDAVNPAVVVMYNYEGVFRRLLPAVVRRGIATLGVQQALGPYVHALKHDVAGYDRPTRRKPGGVPMPDRIALWGQRDLDYLRSYGCDPESLVVTGYPRTDPYVGESGRIDRLAVLKRLGINDMSARIVAYTAVRRVLGTGLMREDNWLETLRALIGLTKTELGLWVMLKPWPGDDMEAIRSALDRVGTDRVLFVDPEIELHNVELLSVVQAVVGTFSSLFVEAILSGAVPVLLDYPETRYYFGGEMSQYAAISLHASDPGEAIAHVRRVLSDPAVVAQFKERVMPTLQAMFGPLDGRSARRVASAAEELAGRPARDRWPASEVAATTSTAH